MNKRTAPNDLKTTVCRIGYNNSVACYSKISTEIAMMSGSSINRQYAAKKKLEFEAQSGTTPLCQASVGETIDDIREWEQEVRNLRTTIAGKQAIEKPVARRMARLNRTKSAFCSKRTKGKVRDKATALYRVLGDTKTFLTLTFIEQVEHAKAIKILNKFLTVLRKMSAKKLHYIWVAELQMENKKNKYNIHFHMIINRKFAIKKINALWVLEQYNAGLRFRDIEHSEILQRYQNSMASTQWKKEPGGVESVLNPVDIEKINGIYGLNYYLTKYITKKTNGKYQILCAKWHCSRSVSRLFTKQVIHRSTFSELADPKKNSRYDAKKKQTIRPALIQGKFHLMYYINNRNHFLRYLDMVESVNRWMIVDDFSPDTIPETSDEELRKFYYDECKN